MYDRCNLYARRALVGKDLYISQRRGGKNYCKFACPWLRIHNSLKHKGIDITVKHRLCINPYQLRPSWIALMKWIWSKRHHIDLIGCYIESMVLVCIIVGEQRNVYEATDNWLNYVKSRICFKLSNLRKQIHHLLTLHLLMLFAPKGWKILLVILRQKPLSVIKTFK